MTRSKLMRLLSLLFAFALLGAACGGSSDDAGEGDGDETSTGADSGDEMADDEMADGADLSGVCPSPLIIQTDWFPESEHGAMYEMIGDDYVVDTEKKVVRGTMVSEGHELGIELEVRTGGPAIGFQPTATVYYTDDSIHLAYQNTESQVLSYGDTPMISVVAPLEKNPQMIMWDPETYPDVQTLADLGTEGVTINVFGGGLFSEVFTANGTWSADQIDPSYDGSPARFISEDGAIAQQGFASAEPYNYENVFADWGKPVAFQLLHDAGFEIYSQTIAVGPHKLEELSPCLEQVVPVIQKAVVSYDADPARANAIIIDAVAQYADFWVYDAGIAEFSVQAQRDLGLIGNGPDSTVGNMEEARIQSVIDLMTESGLDTNNLTPADIMTNQFIDESIGF